MRRSTRQELFRHDRWIAWNLFRATFATWQDRAIAALVALAALAALHRTATGLPWWTAAGAALAAGAAGGLGAARLVAARLDFHGFDGVLAAQALHPPARRRYAAAWHGGGLALLAALTLVARPSLVVAALPGYPLGMSLGLLANRLSVPDRRFGGVSRAMRAWARRPVAGLLAGAVLLSLLPAVQELTGAARLATTGAATIVLMLLLTGVDAAAVRFRVLTGQGAARIVADHGRAAALFLAMAVPGSAILAGARTAAIVAATGTALLLFLALRVLAYRLHDPRFADIVVAILVGVLLASAYALPVAVPVVAFAMLWRLHRRGRSRTWLLA